MLTLDFLNEMAPKMARFHSIKLNVSNKFKTHYERYNPVNDCNLLPFYYSYLLILECLSKLEI